MANKYDDLFKDADDAFNKDKKYSKELESLKGLSEKETKSLTPNTAKKEAYDKLIREIQIASTTNISQAELAENIRKLGTVALKLAKKVPQLAAIL